MTQEEYERQLAEEQRLINEYNQAVARYNALVELNAQLQVELQMSQSAAIDSIKYSKSLAKTFMPIINHCADEVDDVRVMLENVRNAIIELSNRYTTIKNVSTATKNLTQCDDEYERKFRLYNKFRKVCLGYVIGIDSNIISNEILRTTLEKNYLANSDYWVASCIMATMLWVNNEKEATMRALNTAMQTDPKKSTIFFLLVNLRFGRIEAAKQWYNLYMESIDVNDIGEEWQYLLQAYLYKAFGHDKEFEEKINKEYENLLTEVKKYTLNYENEVVKKVSTFADAYPHNTKNEYELLSRHCFDYKKLLTNLTNVEKSIEIAKYYNSIIETNPTHQTTLSRRIEDILYNLINAYDAEEYEVIKRIKYNEYVIKAKGDLAAASKMSFLDAQQDGNLSLIDLIYKFAFANLNANIDNLVRKFAIKFLLDNIEKGYENYHIICKNNEIESPKFKIDGCEFNANPSTINVAKQTLNAYYDKSKSKKVKEDKKHRIFVIFAGIGTLGILISMATMIVPAIIDPYSKVHPAGWICLIVFMVMLGVFTALCALRRKKILAKLYERKMESLKLLEQLMAEYSQYLDDYKATDEQFIILQETLEKFRK